MIQLIPILGIWPKELSSHTPENTHKTVHGGTVHDHKNKAEIFYIPLIG